MIFPKKSLGQNFLQDKNILNKITNLVNLKKKNVIEIGPGSGLLTNEILKKEPKSLILIEKDNLLYEKLKTDYYNNRKVKIFHSDILKLDLNKIISKRTIILGNLPYNISSQILIKFIKLNKWPAGITDFIFMFQKELGERIIGKFKSPQYGRLSIISNYRMKIINKFLVSPNCFFPKPKVFSMLIHFKPLIKKNLKKYLMYPTLRKLQIFYFQIKGK